MASTMFLRLLFLLAPSINGLRRTHNTKPDEAEVRWTECLSSSDLCGIRESPSSQVLCPVPSPVQFGSAARDQIGPLVNNLRFAVNSRDSPHSLIDAAINSSLAQAEVVSKARMVIDDWLAMLRSGAEDEDKNLVEHRLLKGRSLVVWDDMVDGLVEWLSQMETTRRDLGTAFKKASDGRSVAVTELHAAKQAYLTNVSDSILPWRDSRLFDLVQANYDDYLKPRTDSFVGLQNAENKALGAFRKLQNNLVGLMRERSTQAPSAPSIPVALGMLKKIGIELQGESSSLFFSSNGFIDDLKDHLSELREDLLAAKHEVLMEDNWVGDHIDFHGMDHRVPGPFRVAEIQQDIVETFLWKHLPEAFLGLQNCVDCTAQDAASPSINLGNYFTHVEDQPVLCLRASAPECLNGKQVCGCYGSDGLLSRDDAPQGLTTAGCSHVIYKNERPDVTQTGTSLVEPEESCAAREEALGKDALRICMVTWNIGSERQVMGNGVGAGGIDDTHGELKRDLRRLIQEACSDRAHDLVTITLQEGSEPQILEDANEVVREVLGENWEVAAYTFAKAFKDIERARSYSGYKGISFLHRLPSQHKYANGVFLMVAAPRQSALSFEQFSVDIVSSSIFGFGKAAIAGLMGSTGDKGVAVVKTMFERNGQVRKVCFVGAHMDASSESTRLKQTGKVHEALAAIECPDGVWWGGDFNPRLQDQCCPWDRLQLFMHHGMKASLVNMLRRMDPISHGISWAKNDDGAPFTLNQWQCSGKLCAAGWHELPIGFAPTFHKRYHRQGRNWTDGTCYLDHFEQKPQLAFDDMHGPVSQSALASTLLAANDENSARIQSWRSDRPKSGKCPTSGRHVMCWDGKYTESGCKDHGLCYDTERSSHCPLFTDRILFSSDIKQGSQGQPGFKMIGCRYEALPDFTTADHNPVVASFSVSY